MPIVRGSVYVAHGADFSPGNAISRGKIASLKISRSESAGFRRNLFKEGYAPTGRSKSRICGSVPATRPSGRGPATKVAVA